MSTPIDNSNNSINNSNNFSSYWKQNVDQKSEAYLTKLRKAHENLEVLQGMQKGEKLLFSNQGQLDADKSSPNVRWVMGGVREIGRRLGYAIEVTKDAKELESFVDFAVQNCHKHLKEGQRKDIIRNLNDLKQSYMDESKLDCVATIGNCESKFQFFHLMEILSDSESTNSLDLIMEILNKYFSSNSANPAKNVTDEERLVSVNSYGIKNKEQFLSVIAQGLENKVISTEVLKNLVAIATDNSNKQSKEKARYIVLELIKQNKIDPEQATAMFKEKGPDLIHNSEINLYNNFIAESETNPDKALDELITKATARGSRKRITNAGKVIVRLIHENRISPEQAQAKFRSKGFDFRHKE